MLMMHNFLSDIELANKRLFFRNINKRVFFRCMFSSFKSWEINFCSHVVVVYIDKWVNWDISFIFGRFCLLFIITQIAWKNYYFSLFFLFISSSERSGNWTDTVVGKLNYKNVSLFAPCIHHDVIASLY
jgi:hypothetical protein